VDAPDVQGIVQILLILPPNGGVADETCNQADSHRRGRGDEAAAGRDGDQASQCAGEHPDHLGFLFENPGEQQPGEGGDGSGEVRVEEGGDGDGVGSELVAGVETEPAEPEERGADGEEGEVMGGVFLVRGPSADIQDAGERGHAGAGMDDDAAAVVLDAPGGEETVAPDHVDEGEVDEEEPGDEEDEVGFEVDAVGEGAADEGRGDDRDHHLVDDEDEEGDGVVARHGRGGGDAYEEDVVKVADDCAVSAAEAEAVADGEPDDVGDGHGGEALHHDGDDVFSSDEAAVEEGEAWCHEHDEGAAEQHEGDVAGVKHLCCPLGFSWTKAVAPVNLRGFNKTSGLSQEWFLLEISAY